MTLREALTVAAAQLAGDEHLRPTATRDAELLLLHTLQIPRATNPCNTSPASRSSTVSH
jgi:release factor glutamine methyltransferase